MFFKFNYNCKWFFNHDIKYIYNDNKLLGIIIMPKARH